MKDNPLPYIILFIVTFMSMAVFQTEIRPNLQEQPVAMVSTETPRMILHEDKSSDDEWVMSGPIAETDETWSYFEIYVDNMPKDGTEIIVNWKGKRYHFPLADESMWIEGEPTFYYDGCNWHTYLGNGYWSSTSLACRECMMVLN